MTNGTTAENAINNNNHTAALAVPLPKPTTDNDSHYDHDQNMPFHVYLVIANISKHNNVRSLLLTAAAFCQGVILVGMKKFNVDLDLPGPLRDVESDNDCSEEQQNEMTRRRKLPIVRLDRWADCVNYLRDRKIRLVGVEIQEHSLLLQDFCLQLRAQQQQHQQQHDPNHVRRDMALVMGNEGQGLSSTQIASCETLVRIPQFGNGTASLNVYVAASIILQQCHQIQREFQE